jgi:transcriptional activator Myb
VQGKVIDQLRRWHNHLDPGIEKKGWSGAEEEKLFLLHKLHGNKWTVIAE